MSVGVLMSMPWRPQLSRMAAFMAASMVWIFFGSSMYAYRVYSTAKFWRSVVQT